MKPLTNKFNLPEPFVAAVSTDDYVRGDADFTATELVRPTRIVALRRKHEAEIEEDASDRVWAMQGQTKHVVFERIAKSNPDRYIVEQRLGAVMPGGATISGQLDLYDKETRTLYDYKETSVFKFILGDTKEWEEQANVNLFLCRMNEIYAQKLVNVALLKDFKKREARMGRREDYPKCAIHSVELPMWSIGQAQAWILERIKKHTEGMVNPPVCSKKERWQLDAGWAVMKKGRKAAIRVVADRDQAEAIMIENMKHSPPWETAKYYLEERPREPRRCLDYCEVQPFCDYGTKQMELWRDKHEESSESAS